MNQMPILSSDIKSILESDLRFIRSAIEVACENGESVSSIAEKIGVNRNIVSGLRNGTYKSMPGWSVVRALCVHLSIPLSSFDHD
jgi:DNA-binding XRE family transcriptional regulator